MCLEEKKPYEIGFEKYQYQTDFLILFLEQKKFREIPDLKARKSK